MGLLVLDFSFGVEDGYDLELVKRAWRVGGVGDYALGDEGGSKVGVLSVESGERVCRKREFFDGTE